MAGKGTKLEAKYALQFARGSRTKASKALALVRGVGTPEQVRVAERAFRLAVLHEKFARLLCAVLRDQPAPASEGEKVATPDAEAAHG